MKAPSVKPVRCAIYTRVSTDHGLDQEFNSLDAQYDAASAYIKSQAHAGWTLIRSRYDDGGYSGGSTDRPDLQKLLDDIRARSTNSCTDDTRSRLCSTQRWFGIWATSSETSRDQPSVVLKLTTRTGLLYWPLSKSRKTVS